MRDGEGQGGLACCSPWGHRIRHAWVTGNQHSACVYTAPPGVSTHQWTAAWVTGHQHSACVYRPSWGVHPSVDSCLGTAHQHSACVCVPPLPGCPPASGQLGCLHGLGHCAHRGACIALNCASVQMYVLRRGFARSHGNSTFSFLRNLHRLLHGDCTNLQSH